MELEDYIISPIPLARMPTIDGGKLADKKYHMMGLLEIDITNLRTNLREVRKTGKSISLLAFIVKTIGDCIAANRDVHGLMLRKNKILLFKDVDISLPVERQINGKYFPYPVIVRATNKKSLLEIEQEISNEVNKKRENENDFIPMKNKKLGRLFIRVFYIMPQFLRIWIMSLTIKNPIMERKILGTVGVTTVNMIGRLSGWVFPLKNPYNIYFALGSINKKPLVVGNEILIRDVLNLSVIFNHDTIDGAAAKRFMNEFVRKIEIGRLGV